jgi:hypothetical protein
MLQVIPELEALRGKCRDPREIDVVTRALALARRCKEEVGLYLRLAGD